MLLWAIVLSWVWLTFAQNAMSIENAKTVKRQLCLAKPSRKFDETTWKCTFVIKNKKKVAKQLQTIKNAAQTSAQDKYKNNANLVILDIVPNTIDGNLYQGEKAYLTLTYENIGNSVVPANTPMHVFCYINGAFAVSMGAWPGKDIAFGDKESLPLEIHQDFLSSAWTMNISCTIDWGNVVQESNENDNWLVKPLKVLPASSNTKNTNVDMTITSAATSMKYQADNNYSYITVYTKNAWTETAIIDGRSAYLACYENGNMVAGVWVSTADQANNIGAYTHVAAWESLQYELAIPKSVTPSPRNLICTLDINKVVSEINESNNSINFWFHE